MTICRYDIYKNELYGNFSLLKQDKKYEEY